MTISSKVKTPWFRTIFYIIWCILWTLGGLFAFIFYIKKPTFFFTGWLLFWFIAEYIVICIIHWYLFGIETIKIENEEFLYTRNGIFRRKHIKANLNQIKRLDIIDDFGNLHEIEDKNNNLRFDINGKEHCTINKFIKENVENLIIELQTKRIINSANTSYS